MNRIYELEYYKEEINEELRIIKEIIQKANNQNIVLDPKSLAIIKRLSRYYYPVLCLTHTEGFYTSKIHYLRNMLLSNKKTRTSNLLLALAIAYIKRAMYYHYASEQAQDRKDLYLRDELDYKSFFDLHSATNLLIDLGLSDNTRTFLVLYLLGWVYLLKSNGIVERFMFSAIAIFSTLKLQVTHYIVLEKLLQAHYDLASHGRIDYVFPTYEEDFAKVVEIAKEILAEDDVPESSKLVAESWMLLASERYVEYSSSEVAMEYYEIIFRLNKDLDKKPKNLEDVKLDIVNIHFGYAVCHKNLGEYDKALDLFKDFIDMYKPLVETYVKECHKIGTPIVDSDDITPFDHNEYKLKELAFNVKSAMHQMGFIYEITGKYECAKNEFQKAIEFCEKNEYDYEPEFHYVRDHNGELIEIGSKIIELKKKFIKGI